MATGRRVFLKLSCAAAGTGMMGGLVACSSDSGEGTTDDGSDVTAGKATDYAVGSLTSIAGKKVIVGRDAAGLYAMSTICTHEACDIQASGTIGTSAAASNPIACSCHSSTFDGTGTPTGGPAPSPLKHFKITLGADGAVTVNKGSTVGQTVRVAVA